MTQKQYLKWGRTAAGLERLQRLAARANPPRNLLQALEMLELEAAMRKSKTGKARELSEWEAEIARRIEAEKLLPPLPELPLPPGAVIYGEDGRILRRGPPVAKRVAVVPCRKAKTRARPALQAARPAQPVQTPLLSVALSPAEGERQQDRGARAAAMRRR